MVVVRIRTLVSFLLASVLYHIHLAIFPRGEVDTKIYLFWES